MALECTEDGSVNQEPLALQQLANSAREEAVAAGDSGHTDHFQKSCRSGKVDDTGLAVLCRCWRPSVPLLGGLATGTVQKWQNGGVRSQAHYVLGRGLMLVLGRGSVVSHLGSRALVLLRCVRMVTRWCL